MVSPIEVAATKLATDAARDLLKSLKESLARWGAEVDSTQERIEAALERHQAEVKSWAEEISFKDLLRAKATSKVFVPLDIYLLPQRQRIVATERLRSAPLSKLLKNKDVSHLIILGQPGAGKTTAIKHLCQEIVETKVRRWTTFTPPQSTAHAAHCGLVLHWRAYLFPHRVEQHGYQSD